MGETIKLRTGAEMPAYRAGLVAVLDVGSSKTVCLIGRAEPGSLRVVGAALRESQGIRAGTVVNMEQAEESIRDAVAAAENHADVRIQNVIISVNCGQPVSVTSRAAMSLDGELVTDAHLRALLADGRSRCQLEGHELIQSAPTTYVVDEARGVRDPLGMFCQRIGVAMHAVGGEAVAAQQSEAGGRALPSQRRRHPVRALCQRPGDPDRGRKAARRHGHRHGRRRDLHRRLPRRPSGPCRCRADGRPAGDLRSGPHAGGADLGRRTRQDAYMARRWATWMAGADVIPLAQMGEDGDDSAMRVPRSMLTRIIQARLEEIFGEVQTRLRASGFDVAAGRRAVLTGGACQLAGVRELAGRVLNKQVRIGRPQSFPGLPAASAGPDYATAVGLADGRRDHAAGGSEPRSRVADRSKREAKDGLAG